jgi:hypothetical protein
LGQALEEVNLNTYTSPMPQMGFVLFNLNNPEVTFLQNVNVRRALMLGLNHHHQSIPAGASHSRRRTRAAEFVGAL